MQKGGGVQGLGAGSVHALVMMVVVDGWVGEDFYDRGETGWRHGW